MQARGYGSMDSPTSARERAVNFESRNSELKFVSFAIRKTV